jgi:hypothetical protein
LLPHQLSLRISDYYPTGVGQYNPVPIETAPLLYIGLNSLPASMLTVITVQFEAHSAEAYLLAAFAILLDFTSGSLADKEVHCANGNQYYDSESYKETKS